MFSKAVKLQNLVIPLGRLERKALSNKKKKEEEKKGKKNTNEKGEKSQPAAKGTECDFLEVAHTLLASEAVTWQGGTPPKATSKVAWLVPGILIFGNPTFCVPEPDRQTVGGRGRRTREPRREKAAASRADPPEAAEPGERRRSGNRGPQSRPGRRRRPQRHPAHSQDFLK